MEIRKHVCADHELLYIEPVACGQAWGSRDTALDVDDAQRVRPAPPDFDTGAGTRELACLSIRNTGHGDDKCSKNPL